MLIIIKMCMKVNKPLLACSCGMYQIIFQTETNLSGEVNVINGNGEGGSLDDLNSLTKPV